MRLAVNVIKLWRTVGVSRVSSHRTFASIQFVVIKPVLSVVAYFLQTPTVEVVSIPLFLCIPFGAVHERVIAHIQQDADSAEHPPDNHDG